MMAEAMSIVAPGDKSRVHLECRSLSKRFGGVAALSDINLTIERDSFHALVGENGAGKSTLGRILAGLARPSSGELLVDGVSSKLSRPKDALAKGITMVVQERTIVPHMSVVENVMIDREVTRWGVVDKKACYRRFDELCELAGVSINPDAKAGSLRLAEQLRVEILRALARNVDFLVLDEVTAALDPRESQAFFELLRKLRSRGRTIVYVTHFLSEVLEFADRVSILKEGRLVRTSETKNETTKSLVSGMLGRPMDSVYPPKAKVPDGRSLPALSVRNLTREGIVNDVSFDVRPGEIVGLAGLVGSGRSEIVRAVFGADPKQAGQIEIDGKAVSIRSPRDAIRNGIALIPESRQTQGLVLSHSIATNMTLVHRESVSKFGVMCRAKEASEVDRLMRSFDVRAASPSLPVGALSGGNQQKVLFAKWLLNPPRILIADEPTRGVDIGAKHAIYELLNALAEKGTAILVISSELEEVLSLAHRTLVVRNGSIVSQFAVDASQKEAVLQAAFGTHDAAVVALAAPSEDQGSKQ